MSQYTNALFMFNARNRRIEIGMTQLEVGELARKYGSGRPIGVVGKAETQVPRYADSLAFRESVARALNCTVEDLLTGSLPSPCQFCHLTPDVCPYCGHRTR